MKTTKVEDRSGKISILSGFEPIQDVLKSAHEDGLLSDAISGIYCIRVIYNNNNDRRYIGSSTDMRMTFERTKSELRNKKYRPIEVQDLYSKGMHIWFELLEECGLEEFEILTNKYINKYNTTNIYRGWNKENEYCKTQNIDDVHRISLDTFNLLETIYKLKQQNTILKIYNDRTNIYVQGTYEDITSKYAFSDSDLYSLTNNIIPRLGNWWNVII